MNAIRHLTLLALLLTASRCPSAEAEDTPREKQLAAWLKRFPAADTNGDGRLSEKEADLFRRNRMRNRGAPSTFKVDPRWKTQAFPENAVSLKTPAQIREIYSGVKSNGQPAVVSYVKPGDGALRIVGTGHSFMAPGYQTLPGIAKAAGWEQPPLLTHTGGGMTGSARYKWEQENGIFQFDGKPIPKLLSSIANAQWDAMMWGPYYNDQPEYYSCWIDFCLKYNPNMKFYLSDAWPQLEQFEDEPRTDAEITWKRVAALGKEKNRTTAKMIGELSQNYPNRVFVMPTSDAMILAVREFHNGNLDGIEGVHQVVGGKERSLWRDRLGHLGPGLGDLEGYVFYATLYARSPELIRTDFRPQGSKAFPSSTLDAAFRKIAWEAVTQNPLSGVVDENGNGIGDHLEKAE